MLDTKKITRIDYETKPEPERKLTLHMMAEGKVNETLIKISVTFSSIKIKLERHAIFC